MARSTRWMALFIVLGGCGPELEREEAERLVRAWVGDEPALSCWFSGGDARVRGHERIDDRRGRYRYGALRGDDEPGSCFERLQAAGVLSGYDGLEFTLGPRARFVEREDGSHSVAYDCATGRIDRVEDPATDGDRATMSVRIVRVAEAGIDTEVANDPSGVCPGSASSFPSTTCVAELEHTGSGWVMRGFRDADHCPRRR